MNAKKAYNDKYVGQAGKISGNRWYEIQVIFPNLFGFIGFMSFKAFRAINQALGRCLRHRNDWGAILLVDSRWQVEKNRSNVSKWLQKFLKSHGGYQNFINDLSKFMSEHAQIEP